jgi:hypothetical protein
MKIKACASCGTEFSCYADTGLECWCSKYHLAPDTLFLLQEKFDGCLCELCLPEYSTGLQNKGDKKLES